MKVHLFYLRSNQQLYAFTTDKEYARQFLQERNRKLFFYKKEEFDDPNDKIFLNAYKKLQLIDGPLQENGERLSLLMTYDEDSKLSDSCDTLINELDSIRRYFINEISLQPEWRNVILRLTTGYRLIREDDEPVNRAEINTFSLFYHLFRNTFNEESELIQDFKF